MRTEGEITKEEFAEQKKKIDTVLIGLEKEYDIMLHSEEEKLKPDLCWDEINNALKEMFDFSKTQIDRDIIRRFVSKIVPDGKNHFRWYMNLDGHDTTSLDIVTEGRKNHAVVFFDERDDKPPWHNGDVITIKDLQSADSCDKVKTDDGSGVKKTSLDPMLHRPLSRKAKR